MIRSVIQGVTQIQPKFLRHSSLTLRAVTSCDTQSIHAPDPYSQQVRTTYIVKRTKPLPLSNMHKRTRLMKGRNYLYEVVENTVTRKDDPVKVILTSSVEGLGSKGDVIETTPHKARNRLLLPGLAVYASPENLEKYSNLKGVQTEDQASSVFAKKLSTQYMIFPHDICFQKSLLSLNEQTINLFSIVISMNLPWVHIASLSKLVKY
ncbi:large ribosomal subunit protein bL9m [Palaemon carinicauda]|uniref:large ribosomal subunit protein bL9m n=1 Tax=Palaemon carinicauda TaxID=392227 RepID=UPI0035B5D5C1